ncbi:reverse transcriptase domain-containing protein [Ulvibacterium sp.]|uniref:reverse transcriptase domain-containing protein n=1 Tax=Ulvibacterium sp. TaxID=2665914 RepID=UPI003CC5BE25
MRKQEATSGLYLPIKVSHDQPYFFTMVEDWLKFKKYPHIGHPLTKRRDSGWIINYVTNPDKITNHKFVPLLHRTLNQRKYRPAKNAIKNEYGKRQRTVGEKKQRHIFFSSHLDSIIYSYYSHLLTIAYEDYLEDKPYSSVAVAYRKIPIKNGKSGNKSNIEFAFEALNFIEENKHRKLSIIVADVTSFFDNLDHRLLHAQWKRVLEVNNMPEDHYAVYKNLIAKNYVNENELFNRFQHKLMIERFKPHDTSQTELKRKKVSKIYNMRHEKVVAFCTTEEFFDEATDLIRYDKPLSSRSRSELGKTKLKGIPQGTPISATLANIYMLDFDEKVNNAVIDSSKKAYYQRYSDDLIIICDREDEEYFYGLIQNEIEVKAKLDIQRKKTNIYHYELNETGEFMGGIVENGKLNQNKQLEYLGFSYDGEKVRVKTAGFSKFYRTMKRSFRRGAHFAKKAHIPSNSLFETRLYKRFTHVGSKRRLKWVPDPGSPTGYSRSVHYDWGNFISYLNKANEVMKEINGDDTIKRQYRKVWSKFHEVKENTYQELGKVKVSKKAARRKCGSARA